MAKQIYSFKPGAFISGDAQAAGERLEKLRAKNNGLIPATVVDDARPKASPLHRFFEWDDTTAAQKHREQQARELIKAIEIMFEPAPASASQALEINAAPERVVRAFVSVRRADGQRVYQDTMGALADADMKKQVLGQAYSELSSITRKYADLTELAQVVEAVEHIGELLREPIAA